MNKWVSMSGAVAIVALVVAAPAHAQINFEKSFYQIGLGDSISAGEGALPVTHGFVYQLYDKGVFAKKQDADFGNLAIRGAVTDLVIGFQLPQVLCLPFAPDVVTLTTGGNDFLRFFGEKVAAGQLPTPAEVDGLAAQVAQKIAFLAQQLLVTGTTVPGVGACPPDPGAKLLVANYYIVPHPDPGIASLLEFAARRFDAYLPIYLAPFLASGQVAIADVLGAFEGQRGLLLIERRGGFEGPFDFEVHPTNAGHTAIAREFARAWDTLQ
jgi:lysophospholipase L1-like esterase